MQGFEGKYARPDKLIRERGRFSLKRKALDLEGFQQKLPLHTKKSTSNPILYALIKREEIMEIRFGSPYDFEAG
ncbi:hypothetical protein [Proteiniphilum sp.]|jgi:hypothetical protein|uniref:hypothetical protein n=1 Tax=Proteiniphilum sp. TaxID=1926877 RepID=UPI002B1ECE73|nr:hypothetical protein [Proteiniphilum sp.]